MSPIRDDDRPTKRSGCFNPWILGCVGVPLLLVVGCFALAGGGFLWVRSSLPDKPALERARANPAVVEALGTPLESKFFGDKNVISYNANSSDGKKTAQASYSIPLSGPKGTGTIRIEGEKRKGTWHYQRMEVLIAKTGAVIDLRTPEERAENPGAIHTEVPAPPAPPAPPEAPRRVP